MKLIKISDPQSASDLIYNEIADSCSFYKDQNGDVYMVSDTDSGYELKYLSICQPVYQFIRKRCFESYQTIVKNADVKNAYDTIIANTASCPDEVPVYIRVGQEGKSIFYDLNNNNQQVIKISKKGVVIGQLKSVKGMLFNADATMCEQVVPSKNSEYSLMDFISDFFQVDENQRVLLAVYICAAFIPKISHPILIVEGEKGAGKTTLLEKVWQIINPVKKELFAMPCNKDSLVTMLSNNYFCPIDNIGKMTNEYSNVLCQASTGGNMTKRKLFSDNTEYTINLKRIVALNGIDLGITQSDLLDRTILIRLNRIDESKRQPMEIINEKFEKCLPDILGDIFSILSKALSIYPNVTLEKYPRMADFYRYGYAIAEAMETGYGQKFINDYDQNIELATDEAIGKSPFLESVRILMDKSDYWKGTATELLAKLRGVLSGLYTGVNINSLIPNTPNAISRELTKHSHELKASDITFKLGRSKNRYIELIKNSPTIPTNTTRTNEETDMSD